MNVILQTKYGRKENASLGEVCEEMDSLISQLLNGLTSHSLVNFSTEYGKSSQDLLSGRFGLNETTESSLKKLELIRRFGTSLKNTY